MATEAEAAERSSGGHASVEQQLRRVKAPSTSGPQARDNWVAHLNKQTQNTQVLLDAALRLRQYLPVEQVRLARSIHERVNRIRQCFHVAIQLCS